MWWEIPWNLVKFTSDDRMVKTFHVLCTKRRFKSSHLIDNTTKTPNITFWPIWFVFSYFRRSIVGSSGLGSDKTGLCYFWYVEITKFSRSPILWDKYIRTFKIPMQNLHVVQCLQPPYYVQKVSSYYAFRNIRMLFSVSIYFLENVTSPGVLHDYA